MTKLTQSTPVTLITKSAKSGNLMNKIMTVQSISQEQQEEQQHINKILYTKLNGLRYRLHCYYPKVLSNIGICGHIQHSIKDQYGNDLDLYHKLASTFKQLVADNMLFPTLGIEYSIEHDPEYKDIKIALLSNSNSVAMYLVQENRDGGTKTWVFPSYFANRYKLEGPYREARIRLINKLMSKLRDKLRASLRATNELAEDSPDEENNTNN